MLLASSLSLSVGSVAGQSASVSRSAAELRAAAATGSAEAEYELAEKLAIDGIDKHRTEAVLWLKRAAAQGHAAAQTHLSWAYHLGVGVASNAVEAVKWERLAAEKGDASAQFYLGSDYELGLGGLPKSAVEAARWYRRAAEQNHPIAQARLGDLCAIGRGVPRNDSQALMWYRRAAAQNDFGGQLGLGRMYEAGQEVPKDEKEALRWFERAELQEAATADSAWRDGSEMSEARKRDYALAMGAERTGLPGAGRERERLAAKLLTLQRAEDKRLAATVPIAKPEEFCPRLAAVMAAATANFATLRGKGSDAETWEATEALPSMRPCSIRRGTDDDAPPFEYRCTVAAEVDATAAGASREATQQLVSQCLGGSWHAKEYPHSNRITVFFTNETSPLMLEIFQIEWFKKYSIDLTVYAPLAPLILKRSRAGGATDLDSAVDFKSEKAGVGNVVKAFAQLLGAVLMIDIGMTGKVTLDRKNLPVHEALDALCAQVGCVWSFSTKHAKPELYIQRKKPS